MCSEKQLLDVKFLQQKINKPSVTNVFKGTCPWIFFSLYRPLLFPLLAICPHARIWSESFHPRGTILEWLAGWITLTKAVNTDYSLKDFMRNLSRGLVLGESIRVIESVVCVCEGVSVFSWAT